MPVGAEIDALIATRVMGWKLIGNNAHHGTPIWEEANGHEVGGSSSNHWYSWRPSSSIADAWRVVDRMHALGFFWWMASSMGKPGVVLAHVRKHIDRCTIGSGYACATTAHSICVAALEALDHHE